jgi:hypothetical protein
MSEYSDTSAGVSGAYRTRIAPAPVSDTGYVGKWLNLVTQIMIVANLKIITLYITYILKINVNYIIEI